MSQASLCFCQLPENRKTNKKKPFIFRRKPTESLFPFSFKYSRLIFSVESSGVFFFSNKRSKVLIKKNKTATQTGHQGFHVVMLTQVLCCHESTVTSIRPSLPPYLVHIIQSNYLRHSPPSPPCKPGGCVVMETHVWLFQACCGCDIAMAL